MKSWRATSDRTRKEERAGGVSVLSGQRKSPLGLPRGLVGNLVGQLPARADRMRRRVNNRQRARYPITRKRGFKVRYGQRFHPEDIPW